MLKQVIPICWIEPIGNTKCIDVCETHKNPKTQLGTCTFSFCEVCNQLFSHWYFSTRSTPFIGTAPIADRDDFFVAEKQKSYRSLKR